jgi:hypothetical protein
MTDNQLIVELVSMLEDVNEFLEPYLDVDDGDDGQPVANKPMRLQMDIQELLKKVKL